MDIDETDRKILQFLLEDGRMPFATLAENVGISRAIVAKRVTELQKNGVIENFTIVVPSKYIRKSLPAFFDITCSPEQITQIAERLAAEPDIVIIYQMSSKNALHVHGFFRDIEEISTFIDTFVTSVPGILGISTDFILKQFKNDRI